MPVTAQLIKESVCVMRAFGQSLKRDFARRFAEVDVVLDMNVVFQVDVDVRSVDFKWPRPSLQRLAKFCDAQMTEVENALQALHEQKGSLLSNIRQEYS
eukprot:10341525-Karenia_brevis.AAC.1